MSINELIYECNNCHCAQCVLDKVASLYHSNFSTGLDLNSVCFSGNELIILHLYRTTLNIT